MATVTYVVATAPAAFEVLGLNSTLLSVEHRSFVTVVDVAPAVNVNVPAEFLLPSINWFINKASSWVWLNTSGKDCPLFLAAVFISYQRILCQSQNLSPK